MRGLPFPRLPPSPSLLPLFPFFAALSAGRPSLPSLPAGEDPFRGGRGEAGETPFLPSFPPPGLPPPWRGDGTEGFPPAHPLIPDEGVEESAAEGLEANTCRTRPGTCRNPSHTIDTTVFAAPLTHPRTRADATYPNTDVIRNIVNGSTSTPPPPHPGKVQWACLLALSTPSEQAAFARARAGARVDPADQPRTLHFALLHFAKAPTPPTPQTRQQSPAPRSHPLHAGHVSPRHGSPPAPHPIQRRQQPEPATVRVLVDASSE